MSPPVKAEDIASQLYPQFRHTVADLPPVADEPEIPAVVRASVVKPKKTPRLGSHRATPYSTSSTSRPSRRQSQVTTDVASFNFQAAFPPSKPQFLSTYPVQQYQSFNYEQTSQYGACPSNDLRYTLSHNSQSLCPEAPQCGFPPEISSPGQEYPATIDPALLSQDNLPGFDCPSNSPSTPYFNFQDDALSELSVATYASGGIDQQVDFALLLGSNDNSAQATLPLWDFLDTALLDTAGEYDRIYSSWITGEALLQPLVEENSASESTRGCLSDQDDLLQRSLAAGYSQNSFSRCTSPISLWA